MSNQSTEISDAWYSVDGPENDVILSTRIRLARNLVNFPFPQGFKNSDGDRVLSLVFDAFSKVDENDSYQSLLVSDSVMTTVTSADAKAAAISSYGDTAGDINPMVYLDGSEING